MVGAIGGKVSEGDRIYGRGGVEVPVIHRTSFRLWMVESTNGGAIYTHTPTIRSKFITISHKIHISMMFSFHFFSIRNSLTLPESL